MENPKQQLIEAIKAANNVLVTVSSNPSVDQLSAAIGFTLMLNKLGKHATAVFSGAVPSTIEFLEPDKTLERNTDSLRDFIIALDKSKADKLRYKVEDSHVKIFITPYRTSITEKDLDFSQGDFNVDVVVALGVTDPKDLDQAITAHGRILHDATTVSVTTGQQSSLGTVNWVDPGASSLSEMMASTADTLQANLLDGQMATALLTGIVAETKRFSNEKTSANTMSVSAKLMAAGANQQLVASKLQEELAPQAIPEASKPELADVPEESVDGSLQIAHDSGADMTYGDELPALPGEDAPQINIDEEGTVQPFDDKPADEPEDNPDSAITGGSSLILEPPTLGGRLTANSEPEALDPATDPLGQSEHDSPLLSHEPSIPGPSMQLPSEMGSVDQPTTPPAELPEEVEQPAEPAGEPAPEPVQEPAAESFSPPPPIQDSQTLADIEAVIGSPHANQATQEPEAPEPEPVYIETPPPPEFADPPAPEPVVDDIPEPVTTPELDVQNPLDAVVPQVAPESTPEPESTEFDITKFDAVTDEPGPGDVNQARDAVAAAITDAGNEPLPPIMALNAQPLDLEIKQTGEDGIIDPIDTSPDAPFTMPDNLVPPNTGLPTDMGASDVSDPTAPPPVPPPLMPPVSGYEDPTLTPAPDMTTPDQPPAGNAGNPFGLPPA